ncbi:hypothetical protein TWF718_009247 [Orbilia javanica]|uniref:Uncharacterized protein n=1 Tax=Orbilia javanica TaxID=47235 RepID=A0AAN8NSN0_9PEZI
MEAISIAHLITESNIKAYVLPVVTCAVLGIASGGVTTKFHPSWFDIAWTLPRTVLYIWLCVFYFDCSNQKDPKSIEEDRLNKPWRAVPSGRLTAEALQKIYVAAGVVLLIISATWLGGFPEALAFMVETYIYDCASGNDSWWARGVINGLFYMTGQLGATRVAGASLPMNEISRAGYEWCILLGLCMTTTIQIVDFRDQEGDGKRGRRTMPLVFGDGLARNITNGIILFWSIFCPMYWSHGKATAAYILPLVLGIYVTGRLYMRRSVEADRKSFHLYSLAWLPAIYAVPLLSRYSLV